MIKILITISAAFIFIYSNSINKCTNVKQSNICKTQILHKTTLKLNEGWNIVGISSDIKDVESFLNQKCILSAKKLEFSEWKEYDGISKYSAITSLESDDALYIYASMDCSITYDGIRTFDNNDITIKTIFLNNEVEIDNNISHNIVNDFETNETMINVDENLLAEGNITSNIDNNELNASSGKDLDITNTDLNKNSENDLNTTYTDLNDSVDINTTIREISNEK
jgi:hypothetical protein